MTATGTSAPPEVEIEGEPTAVYRLYDQFGELLYVGVTSKLADRLASHAAEKHWWPQVVKKTAVLYGSRGEALMEEDRAIRAESPVHNVAGSPQRLRQVEQVARLKRRAAGGGPPMVPIHLIQFTELFLAPADAYARENGINRSDALHQLIISGLIRARRSSVTREELDEEGVIFEAISEEFRSASERYSSSSSLP